jgi:hypothetical protein
VLLPRFRHHRRAAADAQARCFRVSRSFRRSVGGLVCRLVDRLVGRSVGWSVGQSVGRWVGRSVRW